MRRRSLLCLSTILLLRGLSMGQMSTLPAAQAIADLPGPPKNPPIFSEMTAILQGNLQYRNTTDVRGSVANIEREEIQSPGQAPNQHHTTTTINFDSDGHLIRLTYEDSLGVSTTTNVWENGKLQSQNVSHHRNDGNFPDWNEWQRWTYDKDGRLSEFKAGRDKQEMNDYINFKYDPKGRPLGYELYAQTLTEISYTGNKITLSRMQKNQRLEFFEQAQVVDDKGRVIDLSVSDGNPLKPWYHVTFKYDDRGRVVEQSTDPFKLGSGDDYCPIPGKLVVNYDDVKHSGEQRFYDADGKLVLHTTFEFDRDEILTKLRVLDASGKEQTGVETLVDPESHKTITRPGNVEWEVVYDDHSNWTERRRWFTPADGTPRIMTQMVRQTITYQSRRTTPAPPPAHPPRD
jgi:hypothetical protein